MSNKVWQCDTTTIDCGDSMIKDTTKAYFIRCAIADTTESYFYGYVFDSKTYKPIEKAIVTLRGHGGEYSDTTNSDGKFVIQEFGYDDSCSLLTSHSKYRCLIVNFKAYGTGNFDGFNIKLQRKK